MIKSCLIIVPHEDDELNIAGTLFEYFRQYSISAYILFVTKGDFYKSKYKMRMIETKKVMKILGVTNYKVLNNSDNYKAEGHIYNNVEKRQEVYCQIKNEILQVKADMICCIDYDSHADHRMTAAIFDSVMKELITSYNYRPLVLKGFAYLGKWGGKQDFFYKVAQPTKIPVLNNNEEDESVCLPYSRDDKIRIASYPSDYNVFFWKSKLYQAYKTYMTQCGFRYFQGAINADSIYWYRNTNNLMLSKYVTIGSTSGKTEYLNDFALAKLDSIRNDFSGLNRFDESAWIPNNNGEKSFVVYFNQNEGVNIETIIIYQNYSNYGHIDSFKVILSNGYEKIFYPDKKITFKAIIEKQCNIKWLKFIIISGKGEMGLREIEIFDDNGEFPWENTPFKNYYYREQRRSRISICIGKFVYKWLWFYYRLVNKIKSKIGMAHW